MKSIANQEIKLKLTNDKDGIEYNVRPISIHDEFAIDMYFNKLVKAFSENPDVAKHTVFDFLVKTFDNVDAVIKFAELGKRVVVEFEDAPLYEIANNFLEVMIALDRYRQELKKK